MVQVKLSSEILEIRGQSGGVYFKTGRPGQHIQAMPRHVNYSRIGTQGRFRDAYSAAGAFWALALIAAFGTTWAAYALANLFIDRNGESKRITGYNWYIHYALTFPEAEALPFWKPPHAMGVRPDYFAVVKGRWMYHLEEPDWPDYCCGGYYWYDGEWNGKPEYKTDDRVWWIWWKDPHWVISWGLDIELPDTTYYSVGDNINDYYYNPVQKTYAIVYIGTRR